MGQLKKKSSADFKKQLHHTRNSKKEAFID